MEENTFEQLVEEFLLCMYKKDNRSLYSESVVDILEDTKYTEKEVVSFLERYSYITKELAGRSTYVYTITPQGIRFVEEGCWSGNRQREEEQRIAERDFLRAENRKNRKFSIICSIITFIGAIIAAIITVKLSVP